MASRQVQHQSVNDESTESIKKYSRIFADTEDNEIVISGMAGKFPNCHNIDEYEYNLYNKVDMVDEDERRWRHFSTEVPRRSGKIYELSKFDATFFGVHYRQAHTLDPQTRILIEVAYEAIIDAGINPKSLRGTKTGVYVGACISESEKTWFYEKVSSGGFGITGCSRAMLANRISYSLGLNGPSFLLDTACSSSMYALDVAFSALRSGEIDAAIIGGANLCLHPFVTIQFARLGVLSADGICRPFDKNASGYTRSEAINCLFLQRKADAKRVYATVVYSKTNCDGYKPEGITYPSGKLQEKLLREFYEEVKVSPQELGYLEAHSTGTVVGDPEECRAIDNTLCSARTEPLLVGSVKSNVGHSEPASGICSLVKSCFAFQYDKIPPNINFEEIKSEIPALVEGRLLVVKDVTALKKNYIGVNSFGFGGANAHALLRGLEKPKVNHGIPADDIPRLVTWSGRTEDAVNTILDAVGKKPLDAEYIALLHNIQSDDVTGMVFRGYGIYSKNGMEPPKVLSRDVQHFKGIKRPIVFVFSGMGSQWSEMGTSLMNMPIFRASIERSNAALKSKGLNVIDIITSKDPATFDNILNSFVGIAAIQIGIVDVLRALNIEPDHIIGHSVGELGCGYADGGFTAEQMILAAYYRGKVSLDTEKIVGSMAAVGMGYKKIISILPENIDVACHNGADSCTISGPAEDVAKFVAELKAKDIFAKEVPCSSIPYHSRYIAHLGPQLLKYLKETIPMPKERSEKWLSSSVPKTEWESAGRNLCSAEYHTNNLLSSVLFEETFALLPNNALTIEIAPHGLLQAILKRSMPGGVHIAVTQRGNENNMLFFTTALGKLFNNGLNFPLNVLYPKVEFPVSRGTPGISSLVRWDHSEDWFVTKYENMKTKCSGERNYQICLSNEDEEYLGGHIIDGKILMPATSYLILVWETFSLMYHGPSYMNVPVEFEDVRFIRATNISKKTELELNVMVQYGTGNFEITEAGNVVVTGRITEIENPNVPENYEFEQNDKLPMLATRDFYKELKLRGYHYTGRFRSVRKARSDGLYGQVEWNYNFVTFLDAMMQIHILGCDSRSLMLPTKIRKLRINGLYHHNLMSKLDPEHCVCELFVDRNLQRIIAGGVELIGVQASIVQRRRSPGIPVLERYQFLPHLPAPKLTLNDAVRTSVQLALENTPVLKLKVVEVDTDGRDPIVSNFVEAVEDLPLITGDFMFFTSREMESIQNVHIENGKLITQSNCHFIIVGGLTGEVNEQMITRADKCLAENGYLIIREQLEMNINNLNIPQNFKLIAILPTEHETILVLQVRNKKPVLAPSVIQIKANDIDYSWIEVVKECIENKTPTVLYAFNEKENGLIGLVNCLRKEPEGNLIRCFFIDDPKAPAFNLDDPFYQQQLSLGLAINVYRNGQWGTYRHLFIDIPQVLETRTDHIYANVVHRGDLSSLRWFEGALEPDNCHFRIMYSSLNFRDIMFATGRLGVELYGYNRREQNFILGFEFSGYDLKTGRRVMCMVEKGGVASYVEPVAQLIWEIPKEWSFREAATMPVVYVTVYYAFFMCSDIRKGKSILIHAGSGGVGMAAIRVALAYGLEVFTTCSTQKKRQFLLDTYPELKDSHIGNSRDTSFETMIQKETKGKGVDFVLNSLADDKLQASIRCLGVSGHFLEIGKFDMANDSKLGMNCFLREITFHSVLADRLIMGCKDDLIALQNLIKADIQKGIVKPLPSTVFPPAELENAFRYLTGGKHTGKVLIQLRENITDTATLPTAVLKQVYFNPYHTYVIPGGLGGFGLEMADWMVLRGAKKLVLNSSRGISKDYQAYRISIWESYDCEVFVSTSDITTEAGCLNLIREAEKLGPIGGIFNLAVALRDGIFLNQTKEKFFESLAPKAIATKHLDKLSRQLCPQLQYFVVFSSVSCGRGNAGQTNYGMANSVMERIIEARVAAGYPGKAIEWGAVGEVGLVADLAEDQIDMEIGGTLQQRISSCLQELDTLLTVPDALVASMVVAEKRVGRTGNENIIETVMNIMSIRDLKSVSLGTTLSEMGMDSLMAVEIKQILERDFDLILTPQDLRSLTFQKLQEYEDARQRDNSDVVKMIFGSEDTSRGMDILVRNLGDETHCNETLLRLKTLADLSTGETLSSCLIIPGLEGTVGHAWHSIAEHLKCTAYILQLHKFAELTTVRGIAEASLEPVKSIFNVKTPFYIIAYSYGSMVAMELVALLEKLGYHGQMVLIDGAPDFLTTLTVRQLGINFSDHELYVLLFSSIINQIFPENSKESLGITFTKMPTLDEQMKAFMEYVDKQTIYSRDYSAKIIMAMFRRIKMVADYNINELLQLNVPITLIRPAEVSLQDIDDDYCLSKRTEGKVVLKVIEGNHSTMLENVVLAQLLNDFHPAEAEDKQFDEFLNKKP